MNRQPHSIERQSIAEVGDFEIQMFNLAMKFNSSTNVQLTTSAPILAMQC